MSARHFHIGESTAVGSKPVGRRRDDSVESAGLRGWLIIAVFFGLLGSWAMIAPLRGAIIASGVVKVDGNRKTIQHFEGGIVRELRVREGDHVADGDTLLVLDGTQARTDAEALDQLATVLLLTDARLRAEQEGQPDIELPIQIASRINEAYIARALKSQRVMFETRQREVDGNGEIVRQRIAQLQAQAAGAQAQSSALRSQHVSIKTELETLMPLLEKGVVTRTRLLQLERQLSVLDGQLGETSASIARAEQAIGEQRQVELQAGNQRATAIAQELRDVGMRLAEVLPKLANANSVLERTLVKAPYSGRVVGLSVFAVGAVVGRGERLMDIVPEDEGLIVEARIAVEDVSEVQPRSVAEVRLSGFKQQTTPPLAAQVVSVSADRLTDERSGTPYYVAMLRIEDAELSAYPDIKLKPGMAATAMIPTGSRTVMQYLMAPLTSSFSTALRER